MRRPGMVIVAVLAAGGLVAAVALSRSSSTGDQVTRVYAASSLREAFPALDGASTYNFGGSDDLQRQIERGAPADVFASASPQETQALVKEHRCERPVTFATNVLVLLVPKTNPSHIRSVYDLGRGAGKRLAVAAPGVPIGDYTRRLLRALGLSRVLTRNTVSSEASVSGITSKVALGSADAGFAYATDGRGVSDRVSMVPLPASAQPPVRYQICAVRRSGADTAGARRFIRKVIGSRGRKILKRYGFGLPPRG